MINLTRFIGGCVSFFTIIMSKDAHVDQALGVELKLKLGMIRRLINSKPVKLRPPSNDKFLV